MKKAGFADGKYKGDPITMFSSADSPGKEGALVWRRALESLGFEVKQRSVDQSAFYDACNSLAQQKKIDTCMNMGWLPDFFDGLAMLNANFNGDALGSVNQNPSLQDDPKINAAMNDAAKIADLGRAREGVGQRRQAARRERRGDPLVLGQAGEHRLQERPWRHRQVERHLGPGVHVDRQVADARGPTAGGPARCS